MVIFVHVPDPTLVIKATTAWRFGFFTIGTLIIRIGFWAPL